MKVTISVHGRYHAFELARGLFDQGCLAKLLTTYPQFHVRGIVGADAPVQSIEALELQRRFYDRFGIGSKPDLKIATKFAQFAAKNLPDDSDLLVGWSSATLEAIAPAKKRGMKVIVERGSTHIAHQTEVLIEAYEQCGLKFSETAPEMIAREEEEYAAADFISVPSAGAARSFIDRGFDENNLLVNSLGVDLDKYSPSNTRSNRYNPRIIFAGNIGVRKGIPWLLMAFKKLAGKAELHLFGQIEPAFQEMFSEYPMDNVIVHGPVTADRLIAEYGKSDIFCLPSVEEGFGMVVPQAMASGLAVIISSAVGASDLITPGQEGLVIPPMNEEDLAEALSTLIEDFDQRQMMANASVERVRQGCSWDDYITRTIPIYERCLT